jgi:coenzyme PQQ precursor peptide PqqA
MRPPSKACNGGKTHLSMPPNLKEENMTWNAPKIVEVAVGMEINMYACASRKT